MSKQQTDEEIRQTREQIKKDLDKAIGALKEVREKFRIHSLWELGDDAKILEGIITTIEKLKRELIFPTPEIRD